MADVKKKRVVAATWPFSAPAVSKCAEELLKNSDGLDALEAGINVLESDESYGCYSVGRGGARNSSGHLEQDAAVMEGQNLNFGAVTALQGFPNAISVAKKIMEKSKHCMLTGNGAQKFATENGFSVVPSLMDSLQNTTQEESKGHDTVGMLVRGVNGTFYAGVSTSGMTGKHPGRVGDSALPGCGLYSDNLGGAACCSGDGDQILKYCPAFHIVQLMKQNIPAPDACSQVVKDIIKRSGENVFEMVVIAIDKENNVGAASTIDRWINPKTKDSYSGFPYVTWSDDTESSEPEIKLQLQETR